jgi:carbonic anhydrase
MVLGHSCCGAVTSTIKSTPSGFTKRITDKIKEVIKEESDIEKAVKINALAQVQIIKNLLKLENSVSVCAAVYNIETGEVIVL